jgi:hypothetical protein
MSTQERRELANELEFCAALLVAGQTPAGFVETLKCAIAALRGEQPVEREPSDVAFKLRARALSLTPLMPGSGFQGSPDDIRLMEAASDEIERLRGVVRLARLAGGQNS